MSGEPITHCVVCFEKLTLAELAHSPCKHCHVEYCTNCLNTAFEIAEKDDVCEVFCPNPHCKKPLNADCMEIKSESIKEWVDKELIENKYGVFNGYNGWRSEDLINFILNQRHRDLNDLRRKSSVWEEQIITLKNRAKKNDLNDIPLCPSLLTNQSQDGIDLRMKFRSKAQRSQSVPNTFAAGLNRSQSEHGNVSIRNQPLVFGGGDDYYDSDDIHTDDDFSDTPISDNNTNKNKHKRQVTLGLASIIDEEEEYNECQYNSPISSLNDENNYNYPIHKEQQPTTTKKKRISYTATFKGFFSDKTKNKKKHKDKSINVNPFKKYKKKRKLKKTMSVRDNSYHNNNKHKHTNGLDLTNMRSVTPDPAHVNDNDNDRDRSKSENNKINKIIVSNEIKRIQFNIHNTKNRPRLDHIKSKSAPVKQPQINKLSVKLVQLKPPSGPNTPSSRSREHTPISELSKENNNIDDTNTLTLAPINSTKELDSIDTPSTSSTKNSNDNIIDVAPYDIEDIDDHIDELTDIPKTFITNTNTNTNTETHTITTTLQIPIPNEVVMYNDNNIPPTIQTNGIPIDNNNHENNNTNKNEPSTPPTPNTPPTPASMESNGHFERIMKNIDLNIANLNQTDDKINDQKKQINTNNNNKFPSPEPPEMGTGCNGCHACIIL